MRNDGLAFEAGTPRKIVRRARRKQAAEDRRRMATGTERNAEVPGPAGYVALETLMGEEYVGNYWPADCRVQVTVEGETYWFVKSPWPAVSERDVSWLMWDWVTPPLLEAAKLTGYEPRTELVPVDRDLEKRLIIEFFSHDEDWVLQLGKH